jgi:galactokinase
VARFRFATLRYTLAHDVQQHPALKLAIDAFGSSFRRAPDHAALAPGRVNLIGEHTDYNDGLVMPLAIQHCCAAAVSSRSDDCFRIVAADLPAREATFECSLDQPDRPEFRGRWAAYVAGPALLLAMRRSSPRGADIAIASDVPIGAGLSSSAAAEVATATALAKLWSIEIAPLELAKLCQRAEHEYAGVPCGLMDQFASVFGKRDHALLIDCLDNSVVNVPMPTPDRAALIVTNSGVRHSLAAGEYAARRAACEAAARAMGLQSLRHAAAGATATARLPAEQRNCATHVVAENARVRAFVVAIQAGDLAAAGKLMYASHDSLRDLYRVSCPELDTLVEIARSVPGAYGARMTGGGFGGCTITLCDPAAVPALTRELTGRYRAAHHRDCTLFPVLPSAGARLVTEGA